MAEGNGRIGIPELAVGVPFPALPLQIMAARVADGPLRDLVFTGRTVLVGRGHGAGPGRREVRRRRCCSIARSKSPRQLASIPAGAFALTKEAFYTPVLDRTDRLADINARVVEAWLQPHTYDTIRAYLEKTVGKK